MSFLNTRVRVACICPCIGLGGADASMMSLIKYAHNLDFTGIAVHGDISLIHLRNYEKALNWSIPIHQAQRQHEIGGIHYHPTFEEAVYHAVKDANIIFTWSQPGLTDYLRYIDIPVIEYIQNEDDGTKLIVKENLNVTHFKVACSKAVASQTIPEADIIYNAIDPGRVTPRKGRNEQRRVWRISEDKKILLYMGRLVKEKHPEIALAALRYLTDEWCVVFAGDGAMKEQLKQTAFDLFKGRVAFVHQEYHVGDILAASDCFILPSDYEGHPLALMEAMLSGTPCVYTNLGVMQELHNEYGELGYMVDNGSGADIFAEAILQSISEDNSRPKHATRVVWNAFTASRIADQWEEYIHRSLFLWLRERRLIPIYPVL